MSMSSSVCVAASVVFCFCCWCRDVIHVAIVFCLLLFLTIVLLYRCFVLASVVLCSSVLLMPSSSLCLWVSLVVLPPFNG